MAQREFNLIMKLLTSFSQACEKAEKEGKHLSAPNFDRMQRMEAVLYKKLTPGQKYEFQIHQCARAFGKTTQDVDQEIKKECGSNSLLKKLRWIEIFSKSIEGGLDEVSHKLSEMNGTTEEILGTIGQISRKLRSIEQRLSLQEEFPDSWDPGTIFFVPASHSIN